MFEEDAVGKIRMILKTVCDLHKLPLALTWATHRDHDHLHVVDAANYVKDSSMQGYVSACGGNRLMKGQNVAGKAVNLMGHHSVPDVSVLDLDDYPFVDDARNFGLRAAMAIRLKRNRSGKIEYVSEIFLPTNLEDKVEQNNLIVEILLSLRKNCEISGTMELQIESLPRKQADLMLNVSEEVEASNFPSEAVSESSLAFSNVGLSLKEKIPSNSLETNEPHEQATAMECELSTPEKQSDQTQEVLVLLRAIKQNSSYGGLNSNKQITGKTDEPNELCVSSVWSMAVPNYTQMTLDCCWKNVKRVRMASMTFVLRHNSTNYGRLEVREQNAGGEHGVDVNKQVAEMHGRHHIMSINKRKRSGTQQTKCTPKSRKTTSVVWKFFSKVKENGVVWAKCPKCSKMLRGNSKNGTSNLLKHRCFRDWEKDAKQQPVSNVKSSTTKGANAPPQTKRRMLVTKSYYALNDFTIMYVLGDEAAIAIAMVEVQDPINPDIVQAAASSLVHDDQVHELIVQEEFTTKETLGSDLKDQKHHLLSSHINITELPPTETQSPGQQANNMTIDSTGGVHQSSGQQANNMAIDGTGGVPQAGCIQIGLTAEGSVTSTTSIPTTNGFPAISAASGLKSFLSQYPRMSHSSTEIDRLCSLSDAEINAASNEWEKPLMGELFARVHRLKEAIATCPSSSQLESSPLQRCENLVSTISQSIISCSNLEAEITSLKDQEAQLEEKRKAIIEQRERKESELSQLKKDKADHALQSSQATVNRLKIKNIVDGISDLFVEWSAARLAHSSSSK
ncbi:unnamed protein product [Dovyalis caffra]|uniref:BED-type domain-containing protein n=1 Tax=Dovyalis caffra TaxID=77055 RepID=A0AAV1RQR7_9ROSI|nr:unnamed protein product [Dovyalis caffra]